MQSNNWFLRLVVLIGILSSLLAWPETAEASSACGSSGGHTLCVTVPVTPLVGATTITVTNSPNSGTMITTWVPSGQPSIYLITSFKPSPQTGDYSFVWPTQKYLDASGVLRVQFGSTSNAAVEVPVTLLNGNVSDFQHSSSDWANYLPASYTALTDPVVPAVGDGASNEPVPNDLAATIAATHSPMFLYLGDVYEMGTFTENLNAYGKNTMDGGAGTLWGTMGTTTQATLGNHEAPNQTAWSDYWHGRPLYTSFRFGNVLFFDLASSGASWGTGSAQYRYVNSILTSTTNPPPPCIVAFWHIPPIQNGVITSSQLPMWTLLADKGGDLVLNGHVHNMTQYKPLNDQLQLPSGGGATMVPLVSGAGGHGVSAASTGDSRIQWSRGGTPGALWLTLNGAASGGTPMSLSWAYKDKNGTALQTGTRNCGAGPSTPSITGFSPTSGPVGTSVTINGSGFTGATDVKFNGTSAGSGNFTVSSDSVVTATVPSGATTGPISVVGPGGTGTSPADFTVTVPTIFRVGQIGTVSNTTNVAQFSLSLTVGPSGVASGDTIVIAVGGQGDQVIKSVTDSRGNVYAIDAVHKWLGGGDKCTTALVTARATTALNQGDTITVNVGGAGNAWGFAADEWAGLSSVGRLDQTGGSDSQGVKSTSVSIPTAGPTSNPNEAVFATVCSGDWPGVTAGSGYSLIADLQMTEGGAKRELGFEYSIASSIGTKTATFTLGSAKNWSAVIGTYD